jgi:hypothetical protein
LIVQYKESDTQEERSTHSLVILKERSDNSLVILKERSD